MPLSLPLDTTCFSSRIHIEGGDTMEGQERVRILELAWELVQYKKLTSGNTTKASIEAWHQLFDQAYKTILKTALGK